MKCFFFKEKSKSAPELQNQTKKKKNPASNRAANSTGSVSSSKSVKDLYKEKEHSFRVFTLQELREATNGFNRMFKIGEGGFGSVYKGSILPPNGQGDPVQVAIKRLNTRGFQSHVIDPVVDDEQDAELVVEEETDVEVVVDDLVNRDSEDEEQVLVPDVHAYSPPPHFTTLNLGEDEPSSDMFYNPYMRSNEELKKGDKFRSKEDCMLAIKNWHLANCVDFSVDRLNPNRCVILCRNPECGYRLMASFKKES
ncbi:probable receptor-like protein kinase At5g38990 [Vicia villosa]|uniref:probable receptor-like protein kinase At5g38990 n=1 Tax=Vicia villosa TaxID=3911 RepID=UPI00273B772D|nr:probable receptor-like protein kinase At5g38990 [Vicia villosa]